MNSSTQQLPKKRNASADVTQPGRKFDRPFAQQAQAGEVLGLKGMGSLPAGDAHMGGVGVNLLLVDALRSDQVDELIHFLMRSDVRVSELALNVSSAIDAPALTRLLAAVDALDARGQLRTFQVVVDGSEQGPLDEALRMAFAASRASLVLSGATVRPLLFSHLSQSLQQRLEARGKDSVLPWLIGALIGFLDMKEWPGPAVQKPVGPPHRSHASLALPRLLDLAMQEGDAALLRACKTLAPGHQITLAAVPQEAVCELLERVQFPYALSFHINSPEQAQALITWMAPERSMYQGITLDGICPLPQHVWHALLQQLVAQSSLRAVRVRLHGDEQLDPVFRPTRPMARLQSLTLELSAHRQSPALQQLAVQLILSFKPRHLRLKPNNFQDLLWIHRLLDRERGAFPRLDSLHLDWSSDPYARRDLPKVVRDILGASKNFGSISVYVPDTPLTGEEIQVLDDQARRNLLLNGFELICVDTLRRQQVFHTFRHPFPDQLRRAHWHGVAGAFVAQRLLRGPAELGEHVIGLGQFSDRELRSVASVAKHTGPRQLAGQVLAISVAMENQQLDALDVRELLTTPSGECDHELKAALEKKLTDKGIGGAALQLFHEALALL